MSSYDQKLLATAPVATKELLQGGYRTDILNSSPGKTTPPLVPSDPERAVVSKEYVPAPPHLPFWRTRKGMMIIFVVGIVILGAVIGGAVGGTAGHHTTAPPTNATSQGAGGGNEPGVGQTNGSTTAPIASSAPAASSAPDGSAGTGTGGNSTLSSLPGVHVGIQIGD